MNLIQEIMKGCWKHYKTTTLWTTDAIPFYLNDGPRELTYPIIIMNHISGNFSMAMPTTLVPTGFDYTDSRFQFSVYGNNRQHDDLEDIADRLSTAFHRIPLTLGGGVNHLGTILINDRTIFYDANLKVWTKTQDYRLLAGK